MNLKIFALSLVLVGLTSAQCAASIFNRPTEPPPLSKTIKWTFTVKLNHHQNELVGLTGEDEFLGSWSLKESILLNRTSNPNVWQAVVDIPRDYQIYYRFYTCLVDSGGNRQIKHWETHRNPRVLEPQNDDGESSDTFGIIDDEKNTQRGWLTTETAIQFKLHNNPFTFKESIGDKKLLIKLEPVEYDIETFQHTYQDIIPSARANAEYTRYEYGNSKIKRQPVYGVPYEKDDVVIFYIIAADPSNVAYRLKVLFYDEDKPEVMHLMGYQFIHPESIFGDEGNFAVNIISPLFLSVIGNVSVDYLVTKPLPTPQLSFRGSMSDYWQSNWTLLDVGHRGLGKSLTVTTNAAPLIENTVATMKQSAVEGADAVEFDVQLTKDLIPVIYHDFCVYICLEARTPTKKEDLTKVYIHELTYEQLRSLRTYQVAGGKIVEYPAHYSEPREDLRLFPTLEDFFEKVPMSVGFDIEIKWPQMKTTGPEAIQTISKNLFVDEISEVILTKGCGRMIFITSFDADICTMFRIKQNIYPVAFISPSNSTFIDRRSVTIKDALNHVQAFDLIGVIPHTSHIVQDPSQVKMVLDIGKKILVWGNVNTVEDRTFFRNLNVTALVYDRIDVLIPEEENTSLFIDIQENGFFNYQCLNATFGLPRPKEDEPQNILPISRSRF